jgi:hypothetical protein
MPSSALYVKRNDKGKSRDLSVNRLGFLRISTQPSFGATVSEARQMLRDWKRATDPRFVPCDLDALESDEPGTGTRTTDIYLVSLAAKHGMQLATLDESIGHEAVFVIPH